MSRRIRTGFNRIGVVLAAPLVLLSLGLAFSAWKSAQPKPKEYVIKDASGRAQLVLDALDRTAALSEYAELIGKPRSEAEGLLADIKLGVSIEGPPDKPAEPDYTSACLAMGAAIAAYAASRGFGWIISGFAGG